MARLAHHLGVVTFASDGKIDWIEGGEHVKVEEAVVDRRDQGVGHGMSEPHQKGVIPRRIDYHEIMRALKRADGGREVGDLGPLVGFHRAGLSALDTIMRRQLELYARALSPGAAVLDVMGESFLLKNALYIIFVFVAPPPFADSKINPTISVLLLYFIRIK